MNLKKKTIVHALLLAGLLQTSVIQAKPAPSFFHRIQSCIKDWMNRNEFVDNSHNLPLAQATTPTAPRYKVWLLAHHYKKDLIDASIVHVDDHLEIYINNCHGRVLHGFLTHEQALISPESKAIFDAILNDFYNNCKLPQYRGWRWIDKHPRTINVQITQPTGFAQSIITSIVYYLRRLYGMIN